MLKIIYLLLFILLSFSGIAQNFNLSGIILQADSISVLSSVTIYLKNTPYRTITNGSGLFEFTNLPKGQYNLRIENLGYESKNQTIVLNQSKHLTFYLKENIKSLPTVVVGSGGKTNLNKIGGSVHYISEKELQQNGFTDINKTLKFVPGVNLQEEDGFGLRPNIGLRGTGVERSSKITIMEDGILMAPAPYIAPSAYYFPTIGRMQGIEILKGSSQIKYGPYTTGGAINFISTQIPNQFSGKINMTTGSFGSKITHATIGHSTKHIGFLIETFQYSADGFKTLQNGGNTGFNKADYLAKLKFNTSKKSKIYQSITFKIAQTAEKSNETYLGLTSLDFDENPYLRYSASALDNMQTLQHQYSATHLIKFSKKLEFITSVYYSNFKRNWFKINKVQDSTGVQLKIGNIVDKPIQNKNYYDIITGNKNNITNTLFIKANNRSYYAKGIQSIGVYKFIKGKTFHKMEISLRIHQDQIDRFQWIDNYTMDGLVPNGVLKLINVGIAGTESNRIETANALASYVYYKVKYKKLTISTGLRYENIQMFRLDYGKNDVDRTGVNLKIRHNKVQVFMPGTSLIYKFNSKLNIFSGVHKGFAPPGTKPGTLPEQSINYELGSRFKNKSFFIDLVVFFNDYSNLLGTDLVASGGQGSNDLFNGGEVNTLGTEFMFGYDLLALNVKSKINLPITIVYTYTNATFKNSFASDFEGWGNISTGDEYPYLAKHQLNIQIVLEHQLFSLNVNGNAQSAMRTTPGNDNISNHEKIDAFINLNSSLNYNLHQSIIVFGSITNLTNQINVVAKRPAGLRPNMPRAFNIGIKARF